MSNSILIIGEPGSGKSSAIRTLKPEETFIIKVIDNPLPFRKSNKVYSPCNKDNPSGNSTVADAREDIINWIDAINDRRPEIKNIIIDDFQYVMAHEFLNKATEKGFDKFSILAQNINAIVTRLNSTRKDLVPYVLSHSDLNQNGKIGLKTVGKLLEEKIYIEGKFPLILHALTSNEKYKFLTQNDGLHIAKTPMGMFEEKLIDNDLQFVRNKMTEYFDEEFKDIL